MSELAISLPEDDIKTDARGREVLPPLSGETIDEIRARVLHDIAEDVAEDADDSEPLPGNVVQLFPGAENQTAPHETLSSTDVDADQILANITRKAHERHVEKGNAHPVFDGVVSFDANGNAHWAKGTADKGGKFVSQGILDTIREGADEREKDNERYARALEILPALDVMEADLHAAREMSDRTGRPINEIAIIRRSLVASKIYGKDTARRIGNMHDDDEFATLIAYARAEKKRQIENEIPTLEVTDNPTEAGDDIPTLEITPTQAATDDNIPVLEVTGEGRNKPQNSLDTLRHPLAAFSARFNTWMVKRQERLANMTPEDREFRRDRRTLLGAIGVVALAAGGLWLSARGHDTSAIMPKGGATAAGFTPDIPGGTDVVTTAQEAGASGANTVSAPEVFNPQAWVIPKGSGGEALMSRLSVPKSEWYQHEDAFLKAFPKVAYRMSDGHVGFAHSGKLPQNAISWLTKRLS